VYKDLIPGYRIRQLTALEEGEKVRDEVRRLREGEKMLVRSYKGYLKTLEGEIKREFAPSSFPWMSSNFSK
jgi:nucleolar complex protein 3